MKRISWHINPGLKAGMKTKMTNFLFNYEIDRIEGWLGFKVFKYALISNACNTMVSFSIHHRSIITLKKTNNFTQPKTSTHAVRPSTAEDNTYTLQLVVEFVL